MDTIELALVRHRVADLHRDAQVSRLVAAARSGRPGATSGHGRLRTATREALDRATAWARSSVRPGTGQAQACCA